MNLASFLTIDKLIQATAFLSAVAGLTAGLIMWQVTTKFGSGIVATGYRYTAAGVALIGLAIFIEALLDYIQIKIGFLVLIKGILLVVGTYVIVIGTKLTADKLDGLTTTKKE